MNRSSFLLLPALLSGTLAVPEARAEDAAPSLAPIFAKGTRILFQGDSITDGGRGRGTDPNHIFGQDYAYLIAARHGAAFPDRQLVFLNRGVSGNRVTELAERWQQDTLDLKPDVLSILVGVNDILVNASKNQPVSVEEYEHNYDGLLAQSVAAHPNPKLILGEPFLLPGKNTTPRWNELNGFMRSFRSAVARLARKYHAPVVPYQKVFDEAVAAYPGLPPDYWIWDGVHPTAAGHQRMADEWLRVFHAFYGDATQEG